MPSDSWKSLYPFPPRWMTTSAGHRLHYVDTGLGHPVVMLHGNPTWSFFYRNLIRHLADTSRRAIAPDHIGCGLSDKPQNWTYRLQDHIDNLTRLIDEELKLDRIDLVLHDWGGPIGMGYAVRHSEKIRRIILMNTAAFTMPHCPFSIRLVRTPYLGAFLVRVLNLFVRLASRIAPATRLDREVRDGYAAPYPDYASRVALQRFAQDVPLSPDHPSWPLFHAIEEALPRLADKRIFLCWGGADHIFNHDYFDRWRKIFPHALAVSFPHAAHYLLEDDPTEIIPMIAHFLK